MRSPALSGTPIDAEAVAEPGEAGIDALLHRADEAVHANETPLGSSTPSDDADLPEEFRSNSGSCPEGRVRSETTRAVGRAGRPRGRL